MEVSTNSVGLEKRAAYRSARGHMAKSELRLVVTANQRLERCRSAPLIELGLDLHDIGRVEEGSAKNDRIPR